MPRCAYCGESRDREWVERTYTLMRFEIGFCSVDCEGSYLESGL